jgi:hypothetical protein
MKMKIEVRELISGHAGRSYYPSIIIKSRRGWIEIKGRKIASRVANALEFIEM